MVFIAYKILQHEKSVFKPHSMKMNITFTIVVLLILAVFTQSSVQQTTDVAASEQQTTEVSGNACSPESRPAYVTGVTGTLMSPNYPGLYDNNATCQWVIAAADPDEVVELDFSDFDTESGFDLVRIYDGETASATLLYTLQGHPTDEPTGLMSTQRYMFVQFISDAQNNYRGFSATFTSQVAQQAENRTDKTGGACTPESQPLYLNGSSGTFASQNYPNNYYPNADCRWIITATPDNVVALNFVDFATESAFDNVRVFDGDNMYHWIVTYSGNTDSYYTTGYYYTTLPYNVNGSTSAMTTVTSVNPGPHYSPMPEIISVQQQLFVWFVTDSSIGNYRGFNATFRSQKPDPATICVALIPGLFEYINNVYTSMYGGQLPSYFRTDCSIWLNYTNCLRDNNVTSDAVYQQLYILYSRNLWNYNWGYYYYFYQNIASYVFACNTSSAALGCDFNRLPACVSEMFAVCNIYNDLYYGQLQFNDVNAYCSLWSNSSQCLNDTHCTNDNVNQLLQVYPSDVNYYYYGYGYQDFITTRQVFEHVCRTNQSVNSCDNPELLVCVSQTKPAYNGVQTTFQLLSQGQLQIADLTAQCSVWLNYSQCLNTYHCYANDTSYLLSVQSYYWQYYWQQYNWRYHNADVSRRLDTYQYICGAAEQDLMSHAQCYNSTDLQSNLRRCDRILQSKRSYLNYFYYYSSYCSFLLSQARCYYNSMKTACDTDTALQIATHLVKYTEMWSDYNVVQCHIDTSQETAVNLPDATCDEEQFIQCVIEFQLHHMAYPWSYYYTTYNFLDYVSGGYGYGSLDVNALAYSCQMFANVVNCSGCHEDDDYFRIVLLSDTDNRYDQNYNDYYYYWNYDYQYLTIRRLQLVCSISTGDLQRYVQQCYSNANTWNIWYTCTTTAYGIYQNYSCDYAKYVGECYINNVTAACPNYVDAAQFLVEYFMREWQPQWAYTYGCNLDLHVVGCDDGFCVSQLSQMPVTAYMSTLSAGSMSQKNVTDLCGSSATLSDCLGSRMHSNCAMETDKYLPVINEVAPSVCSNTNQQVLLASESCYASATSSQYALNNFFSNVESSSQTCRQNLTLLQHVYDVVNPVCGSNAGVAVVTYALELEILRSLQLNASSNCSTVSYPNATAQFLGPFYMSADRGYGAYNDFYFTCRVNLSAPTNDSALFDVGLTVDGLVDMTSLKTTNTSALDVRFTSDNVKNMFGHTVSCAVRSYWRQLNGLRSVFRNSSSSYFVGVKYETSSQFNNSNRIEFRERTQSVPIYFYSTVPVSCPPCSVSFPLVSNVGLVVSNCSVTLRSTDAPLTRQLLTVRAVPTPGTNSRVAQLQFGDIGLQISGNTAWNTYQMNTVKVLIIDEYQSRVCSSSGDPHISTFDYAYYSIYFAGDFLLWKSYGTRLTEVHVRQVQVGSVAVNCAVAVRENNNALGVFACDSKPPTPVKYLVDPWTPGASIKVSRDGTQYTIMMPSGLYVTVYVSGGSYMNIAVYPAGDDSSSVGGLCGNDNGDWTDDFILRNSTTRDMHPWEPNQFAASYMLAKEDSMINGHIYYPKCVAQVRTPTICQCGTNGTMDCSSVTAVAGSTRDAASFSTLGTNSCVQYRRRRDVSNDTLPMTYVIQPDDIAVPSAVVPPTAPLHSQTLTWPTPSGITEQQADTACRQPIINSPVYTQCTNFTANSLQSIVDSCVADVQLMDSLNQPVSGVLIQFHEACLFGVQQSDNRTADEAANDWDNHNTSSVMSSMTQQLVADVVDAVCPGQPACSGHGVCSNSLCTCSTGFVGADCSIDVNAAPVLTGSRCGSVCDARRHPSNTVNLFATRFTLDNSFACKAVTNGQVFYTASQMVSSGEVVCDLPLSPVSSSSQATVYNWTVSISNNNNTFSSPARVVFYDSRCMSCSDASTPCQQLTTACQISGQCFAAGEHLSTDSCFKCDPQTSTTAWTTDGSVVGCMSGGVATTPRPTLHPRSDGGRAVANTAFIVLFVLFVLSINGMPSTQHASNV